MTFTPEPVVYVVKQDDYLRLIATEFYGDEMRWPLIYEANPQVGNDPCLILVGERLVIPGI